MDRRVAALLAMTEKTSPVIASDSEAIQTADGEFAPHPRHESPKRWTPIDCSYKDIFM